MLPLLAAVGALGTGLVSLTNARANNAEAARRERLNGELASLDTRFGAFQKGNSRERLGMNPLERKSMLGAALSGGLSGALQGANVASAIDSQNAYKSLLSRLSAGQGGNEAIRMIKELKP